MTVTLTRRYYFRALHQLGRDAHECNTVHGHHYALEVSVTNKIDSVSGLLTNRDDLDDIVEKTVLQRFDRKNLNGFLKQTSGEILVQTIYLALKELLGEKLVKVALQETKKNRFVATLAPTSNMRMSQLPQAREG